MSVQQLDGHVACQEFSVFIPASVLQHIVFSLDVCVFVVYVLDCVELFTCSPSWSPASFLCLLARLGDGAKEEAQE